MSRIWGPCLDWKWQFSLLRPYFENEGGVVHVQAGQDSPISVFARAVRSRLETEKWHKEWLSVQIDPENSNTHYVTSIISQIRRSIGLDSAGNGPLPNINFGTDNKAKHDIFIHDNNIGVTYDQRDKSDEAWERAAQLCADLEVVLETRRIALIFTETHKWDSDKLTNIGHILWDNALEKLVIKGLLVIDICDHPVLRGKAAAWPPDPHCIVPLPDQYDKQSRAEAFNDLVSIAMKEPWYLTAEEAKGFAGAILGGSYNIRDAYTRLATWGGNRASEAAGALDADD